MRFKVCCIQSVEEIRLAVDAGASAVGLVSDMPSGFGPIPEERIRELADAVPPGVTAVLLTSLQDPEAAAAQQRRTGAGAIQFCDAMDAGAHERLRRMLPGVKRIQVVHVTGPESLLQAKEIAPHVDAILLDSGDPSLAVKELGGTGRVHDWSLSRRIRASVPVPVFLAGGLNAENAARAAAEVRPYALDVCTGLRVDGRLDPERLREFREVVRFL